MTFSFRGISAETQAVQQWKMNHDCTKRSTFFFLVKSHWRWHKKWLESFSQREIHDPAVQLPKPIMARIPTVRTAMRQNQLHSAHWSGNTAWNMQTLDIWLTQTHTRRQMNTNEPGEQMQVLLDWQTHPCPVNSVHETFVKYTLETDIWKDKVYRHTDNAQGNTLSLSIVFFALRLNDIAKLGQGFKPLRYEDRKDAGGKRFKARLHGKHIGRRLTWLTLRNPHWAHLFIVIHLSDSTRWLSKLTLAFCLNGQMHWRLTLLSSHPPNSAVVTPIGHIKWNKLETWNCSANRFWLKHFTKTDIYCMSTRKAWRHGKARLK